MNVRRQDVVGWRPAAALVLAAAISGCGMRGMGQPGHAVPSARSYEEALTELARSVDTVSVEGHVSLEDRSSLPEGTVVTASSRLRFERRTVGRTWETDEEQTRVFMDTVSVKADGAYRLMIPALVQSRLVQEIPYRSAEGRPDFVRLAEYAGIELAGRGGEATAAGLLVNRVEVENRLDITLRYPPVRLFVVVEACSIRQAPSVGATVVATLAFGVPVSFLRREGDWARVRAGVVQYGWALGADLGDMEAYQQAGSRREEAWRKEVDRYHYPPDQAEALKARRILVGMNENMVRKAWGEPDRREVSQDGGKSRVVWLYLPRAGQGSRQVVFEGGRVVSAVQN